MLVILGRTDEAKSMVAKAYSKHPDDRELRSFVGGNGVDRMASDPGLKEISP